ncbi:hypothetical protein AGMMS49965_22700 [Bacteroidia bacterium]|nr:hypothetical protein AGMMS49965_22700 [Bacteroidia bacterium]
MKPTMDGYSLAEKMRKARRRERFTAVEQALFYELVAVCNEENWSDVFDCSNVELCFVLEISKNTLVRAREKLISSGMIFYKSGKSRREVSSYSFIPFKTGVKTGSKFDPDTGTVAGTDTGTVAGTDAGHLYIGKTETKSLSNESEHPPETDFEKFNVWLRKNAPYCADTKHFPKQITAEGLAKLKAQHTSTQISDVILQIENRKDLRKRYTDLYRTVCNWLKQENGNKNETENRKVAYV